jgi:hypothetical protein
VAHQEPHPARSATVPIEQRHCQAIGGGVELGERRGPRCAVDRDLRPVAPDLVLEPTLNRPLDVRDTPRARSSARGGVVVAPVEQGT